MASIFSRIIAGEIPSTKIYEDDLCIAILDISPVKKGHTLVIPKEEIVRIHELPTPLLHHCMDVCQKIMKSMITNIPCDFVQLRVVGEEVPHCHIHLLPTLFNTEDTKSKISYKPGEMEIMAEKIKI